MPNEPQKDLVIEARELLARLSEWPKTVTDIEYALFADAVERERQSPFFGRAKPVAKFYARAPELLRQFCDEIERRDELIVHMYVHSGYRNNGYLQMTTPQKALYDDIWQRSVKALDEEEAKVDHDYTD